MISFPTLLLRLVVALVLGGLIGLERESKEHNAGIRTIALIALGTAFFSIISAYGFTALLSMPHTTLDPTRIASYIIAGIGFLGGGTIFYQQGSKRVKGLTTAAAIWTVAAIGMACGVGLLLEAITTTILALCILHGLWYLERYLWPNNMEHAQIVRVEAEAEASGQLLGQIYDICLRAKLHVEKVAINSQSEEEKKYNTIEITCRSEEKQSLFQAVRELQELAGVRGVEFETHNKSDTLV